MYVTKYHPRYHSLMLRSIPGLYWKSNSVEEEVTGKYRYGKAEFSGRLVFDLRLKLKSI